MIADVKIWMSSGSVSVVSMVLWSLVSLVLINIVDSTTIQTSVGNKVILSCPLPGQELISVADDNLCL